MSLGRRFPISRSKFVENYIPLILDVVLCTRILFWQETQLKSRPDPHEHRATNTSQFWACPTMSSTWSTGKSGPGSIPWIPHILNWNSIRLTLVFGSGCSILFKLVVHWGIWGSSWSCANSRSARWSLLRPIFDQWSWYIVSQRFSMYKLLHFNSESATEFVFLKFPLPKVDRKYNYLLYWYLLPLIKASHTR